MAPATPKANYKSYEAQARMVRAIVAAHPEVKWNYKEIVACYGSDMTEHALNHRFRRLRAHCVIIREGRAKGLDMKNLMTSDELPEKQEAVDKQNIAKYFGESTADGIQFQFRSIKKDVQQLKKVEKEGGNVARCLDLGAGSGPSAISTPSRSTGGRGTGSRSGGTKRKASIIKPDPSDEDENMDDEMPWSEMDEESPSKRLKGRAVPGQKTGTPSRRAAVRAAATIADASAQHHGDDSPSEAETPISARASSTGIPTTAAPASIFGPVVTKTADEDASANSLRDQRIWMGADAYLNPSMFTTSTFTPDSFFNSFDGFDDGEI